MQLKRALADYQNLERRVSEEKKVLSELYTALVIEKFLPVLDNLEAAQSHLSDEGLALVISQFKDTLTKEGVEEIAAEGTAFNPKLHEAIETVQSEGAEDGTVVKVLTKGYKINNKVIRPARVAVAKADSIGQNPLNQEANLNE